MGRSNEPWWSPDDDDWFPLDDDPNDAEAGDDADDPYGLFDDDLQAYIESESRAIDAAIFGVDERDGPLDDELLEESAEFGQPQVIRTLFDPPLDPPDDESLDDLALRREYDALIDQLARFNIRLDTCEHFSLRECYRYLVDVVLEEEAYPNLGGTDVDQYFMTHDDCPECSQLIADDEGEDGEVGDVDFWDVSDEDDFDEDDFDEDELDEDDLDRDDVDD